jgi:hypothetical protein
MPAPGTATIRGGELSLPGGVIDGAPRVGGYAPPVGVAIAGTVGLGRPPSRVPSAESGGAGVGKGVGEIRDAAAAAASTGVASATTAAADATHAVNFAGTCRIACALSPARFVIRETGCRESHLGWGHASTRLPPLVPMRGMYDSWISGSDVNSFCCHGLVYLLDSWWCLRTFTFNHPTGALHTHPCTTTPQAPRCSSWTMCP